MTTSTIEMPRNLVAAVGTEGPTAGRHWLSELPGIVEDMTQRWSLRVGKPFQPGGTASWVAPARGPDGEHQVLKVAWCHDEALHEADGLHAWDGCGAVRLRSAVRDGPALVMLLEECEPGTALSRALPAPQQDEVVSGLLRRLWIGPPGEHPFRSLRDMCTSWADSFEAKIAATGRVGRPVDAGLVRTGTALFRDLPVSATRSVLLATDLHPDNVLAATREPWLVIDPKPHVGDPTYDAVQHMLNSPDRLGADPAAFVRRMAGLLDLDAERLGRWVFARCVLEWLGRPDLREVAAKLAP